MKRIIIVVSIILFGLVILGFGLYLVFFHPQRAANATFTNLPTVRSMRVDYLDMAKSREEVAALETNMQQSGINMVALGAGRADWAYFIWRGHSDRWSDEVETSGIDYLLEDSNRFSKWAHISAVVDVLAPRYIQAHPESAAISWLGVPSTRIVGTMELVDGPFSHDLLDMINEVATYYPVNSITISELVYYVDGFGEQDKAAYMAYTGRSDWPRAANGMINIDEPTIGVWRSYEIGRFLQKAAAIVKPRGKQLFVDVPIDVDPSGQVMLENGTDFNLFLEYADRLIVRVGSDPDERSLSSVTAITQYLASYPRNRLITGIGLWSKDYDPGTPKVQMSAQTVTEFQSALQGVGGDLWVTPSFLMSKAHWQVLKDFRNVQPNN